MGDSTVEANTEPSVDLTSCDREPIHLLGAIQSFGYLLAVSTDWIITRCSANLGEVCDRSVDDLLGALASDILTEQAIHDIRNRLQWLQSAGTTERIFGQDLFGNGKLYDVALHLSDELIVIEFEPSASNSALEPVSMVRSMMAKLCGQDKLDRFLFQAARQIRFVTDFDRVMVYKFLPDGSGEVVADACAHGVESFMGLRYPASDIPKQARALYLSNPLRIIADIDADIVPIVPQKSPDGQPLDLSSSILRAVSPIHIEYLRNMGVRASMSVSIIVDGELWGLLACHHFRPKTVEFERRTTAELFGQMFSLELANRERQLTLRSERDGRKVHDQIMSTMSTEGSVFDNLANQLEAFQDVMQTDGTAIWVDGEFSASGQSLTREEMQSLIRFLNQSGASRIYATDALSTHHEPAEDYANRVAGVLAIPVSRKPRDYLVLTRKEIAQSVQWAGNPNKPAELGPNGVRLTPRKSFEAWREVVRGTSAAWTPAELQLAESLRTTLLEVILRSVDDSNKVRERAQATQDLLIAELNHRVRNILSLVRGIVAQTGESSATIAEFSSEVGGRIQALARAHDQLTGTQWAPSSLKSMLENELEAYLGDKAQRVELNGPRILLDPRSFTTMALVVHEMVTNSAKYGALTDGRGSIDIDWEIDDTGSLKISWTEKGGPPVKAPKRRGFGSTIIERSVPYELQGEASIEYALTGVRAHFLVPGRYVSEDTSPLPRAPVEVIDPTVDAASFEGHALLVEDNVVIAMEAEDMLLNLGFEQVSLASTVSSALSLIEQSKFAFALLDINLGDETSTPIADELNRRGIPFLFASGYGDTAELPGDMNNRMIVTKPYSEDTLRSFAVQVLSQ
ncbi:MAG: HWE histidine kinase domain-containing protein [Hyphomicrobiales bacterium]|jgi:light-regulated signal transduction histidine kinase (bacteriophytochrome)